MAEMSADSVTYPVMSHSRRVPLPMPPFRLPPPRALQGQRLSDIMLQAQLAPSSSQARRLINQGGVRLDDLRITENVAAETLHEGVLQVGRRRMVRLVSADG